MKSSKMTEAVHTHTHTHTHTGNQINEELIINNEEINSINAGGHKAVPLQRNYSLLILNYSLLNKSHVGADASVRPEHKGNTQKGITLLALIITIIVLLILSVVMYN